MSYEAEEVGIPWGKQKRMATWSKGMAQMVAKKLMPLIGKKVVLYGGGGDESNIGTLKSIKAEPKFYFVTEKVKTPRGVKIIPDPAWKDGRLGYHSPTDYNIKAELRFSKGQEPFSKPTFSPSLGSWRIAKLKKVV